jgi:uncharacterized protein (DUF433 family)
MCALSQPHPIDHIRLDANGSAWIEGTTYRVTTVVLEHLAYGWTPEEIRSNHYDELTLSQIYSALAYYYDHQEKVDAEIAAELEDVEKLRQEFGETPFHRRMRLEGKRK